MVRSFFSVNFSTKTYNGKPIPLVLANTFGRLMNHSITVLHLFKLDLLSPRKIESIYHYFYTNYELELLDYIDKINEYSKVIIEDRINIIESNNY